MLKGVNTTDVFVDGLNLAKALISANHVGPYNGGKREGWCVKWLN